MLLVSKAAINRAAADTTNSPRPPSPAIGNEPAAVEQMVDIDALLIALDTLLSEVKRIAAEVGGDDDPSHRVGVRAINGKLIEFRCAIGLLENGSSDIDVKKATLINRRNLLLELWLTLDELTYQLRQSHDDLDKVFVQAREELDRFLRKGIHYLHMEHFDRWLLDTRFDMPEYHPPSE